MKPFGRWFLFGLQMACLAIIAGGIAAYIRLVTIPAQQAEISQIQPPPDVPCTQDMTLLPGQSCYMQVIIPERRPRPTEDSL